MCEYYLLTYSNSNSTEYCCTGRGDVQDSAGEAVQETSGSAQPRKCQLQTAGRGTHETSQLDYDAWNNQINSLYLDFNDNHLKFFLD